MGQSLLQCFFVKRWRHYYASYTKHLAQVHTLVALKLRPFCLLCYDGAYVQSLALRGLGYPRTLIFTNFGDKDPNFDKIALSLLSLTTFCCRSLWYRDNFFLFNSLWSKKKLSWYRRLQQQNQVKLSNANAILSKFGSLAPTLVKIRVWGYLKPLKTRLWT